MSANCGVSDEVERSGAARRRARVADLALALSALVALLLGVAAARAPRFALAIPAGAITPDGGWAYTFSPHVRVRWPYAIPGHRGVKLARGDVRLLEEGVRIGSEEPDHDSIRQNGGGSFDFRPGTLWFSASDGSDPRSNGAAYQVWIRARLARSAATVGIIDAAVLLVLGFCRLGRPVLRASAAVAGAFRAASGLVKRRIPLTFGRTFALAAAALLGGFCWQALVRPMPLLFTDDSYGYLISGIDLAAAGATAEGQSTRDIGYPLLTWLAVHMGSLATLAVLQLAMVVGGLTCLLAALYVALDGMAARFRALGGPPRWISALLAVAVAVAYVVALASHDLFVVDIDSLMAEAPHVLPTAAALSLLVGGVTAASPRRRLILSMLAATAAYLSIMVKPHSSVDVALCIAVVIASVLRDMRTALSMPVLLIGLCCMGSGVALHKFDLWMSSSADDFGPKTLFCNHLDVVAPSFDVSTPERAEIARLAQRLLQSPVKWPVMGLYGDPCVYGGDFKDALTAAARNERTPLTAWLLREFLKGVWANPGIYAADVGRQMAYFMARPIANVNYASRGKVSDSDWTRLQKFDGLLGVRRSDLDQEVHNWFPDAFPGAAAVGKSALDTVLRSFAAVTLGGSAFAVGGLLVFRRGSDRRPEITVLTIGAFTICFALTTAAAHTFDIERYLTDILPFSLLWWIVSASYLGHVLILAMAGIRTVASTGTRDDRPFEPKPEEGRRSMEGAHTPSA